MTMASDRPFRIKLPATSANLGPAFDAAALALDLHMTVEARPAAEFHVSARGRDASICSNPKDHMILTTYSEVLSREGRQVQPLSLKITNQIPVGKGCGSSASARLAGIALAVHYGRLGWKAPRIIAEATEREHHPDNAAACWMGGLAIARLSHLGDTQAVRIAPKGKWPLLLAVPEDPLSTEQARNVLPMRYARPAAVANLQNSLLLVAALSQNRRDLLPHVLQDQMHQPYRAALCPLLPALEELRGTAGILGVVLSGAGPSVLLFLDPEVSAGRIRTRVQSHLEKHSLAAELIPTTISRRGAGFGV